MLTYVGTVYTVITFDQKDCEKDYHQLRIVIISNGRYREERYEDTTKGSILVRSKPCTLCV